MHALASLSNGAETPHIVRYQQAWIEDERLFIVMELCSHSLEAALAAGPPMAPNEMFSLCRQMLMALEVRTTRVCV